MRRGHEQPWQIDPARLASERVQVWSANGTMLTAQIPLEVAREMVKAGTGFVISSQAVGHYDLEPAKKRALKSLGYRA